MSDESSVDLVCIQHVGLSSIAEALEHGRPWLDPAMTDRWLIQRFFGQQSFVAVDRGRRAAVGIIIAAIEHGCTPAALYVDQLAVAAAYRRHGVARELLAASEHVAIERGVQRVWLTSDPLNPASSLWHAMGFAARKSNDVVSGWPVQRDFKGVGRHRVVFEKQLSTKRAESDRPMATSRSR